MCSDLLVAAIAKTAILLIRNLSVAAIVLLGALDADKRIIVLFVVCTASGDGVIALFAAETVQRTESD